VEAARDHLGDFVRATYQGAPFVAASSVLTARSPDEVIAGMGYLDNLAGGERRAITKVTQTRLVAAQQRATVADRKQIADRADAAARRALDDAQDKEADAEAAQDRVLALVDQRRQALQVAEQEKTANTRQYEAAKAESRRIAAALREAARRAREQANRNRNRPGPSRPGGSPGSSSGDLSMPVDGWKSSDFGLRYDPYYRVWQLHAGTDFAAPGGAPIRAADDGVVVRAGRNGGYGNYTCVYHGDVRGGRGLSTCYAHQSSILVGRGEQVSRGEVIGRVGTTGASTGNHLHFEVRLDGEPVNPLRWL
jgi:murein DD-endopeptidase MepM/ murein hydrolase activator NlpD